MPDITSGRRELILFVDDDASLFRLGRLTLERAGYAYLGALRGREALQKARDSHPDLILLDYMMPDISGKDVFDALRRSDDAVLRNTPMVSDCPYRDALPQEVAFESLRAGAATQFDPILVCKLISYLSQEESNTAVPAPLNFESFEATCQIVKTDGLMQVI